MQGCAVCTLQRISKSNLIYGLPEYIQIFLEKHYEYKLGFYVFNGPAKTLNKSNKDVKLWFQICSLSSGQDTFVFQVCSQYAQSVIFPPRQFFFLPAGYFSSLPIHNAHSRLFFLPSGYFSSPPIHNLRSAGYFSPPPFIIPPPRLFFLPADFIQFLKTIRLCDLVPSPLLILRLHIRYLKHVCSSQQLFNKLGYDWKHIILQPNVL